ncbi:DNA-directed RNA polymerase II [Cordyceps militaris CM01]|uniref:DNA-directed RNA polymerase II n=1 Tax=Cordyceps militaris (strain CM01) TaxID=983644 RepID=G3JLR7_CORMM|nr:DNA-directed RNA polymerase II [Cordyceps militaris CM01]EGX90641.1 DNA-directed RNA polymerase II [Cordyceps militaris CM01]
MANGLSHRMCLPEELTGCMFIRTCGHCKPLSGFRNSLERTDHLHALSDFDPSRNRARQHQPAPFHLHPSHPKPARHASDGFHPGGQASSAILAWTLIPLARDTKRPCDATKLLPLAESSPRFVCPDRHHVLPEKYGAQSYSASVLIPSDTKWDPNATPPQFTNNEDTVIEPSTHVRVKIIGTRTEVGEMWAIGSIKEDYLG